MVLSYRVTKEHGVVPANVKITGLRRVTWQCVKTHHRSSGAFYRYLLFVSSPRHGSGKSVANESLTGPRSFGRLARTEPGFGQFLAFVEVGLQILRLLLNANEHDKHPELQE